ncbi:SDR family oxidoreductase [Cohnella thermotolerans]|uniref:SDR family oxidoreductase n=1 Tax=Cohnella thermotolerans TaxID=329858 RepID=UPI0003FB2597|nr:SDR family oxidoreductase [Cohnella thermotolerans]
MNILITGAGRGLGLELTNLALERGHAVAACVRDANAPSDSLRELAARYPDSLRIEQLDIVSEPDAERLAERLKADSFRLDALVNNAGILLGRAEGISALSMDDVRRTFEVNLFGPLTVAKHLTPLLRESESGADIVINVSSEAGSFSGAYGGDYPYALSKIALNMFSKQLNEELKLRGIRVLAVHPGWIRTDMGGSSAPLSAADSARGIMGLIEGATVVPEDVFFVDYAGRPMPL